MLFNLYVGRVLYLSTLDGDKAFRLFRLWAGSPGGCNLKFIPIPQQAS